MDVPRRSDPSATLALFAFFFQIAGVKEIRPFPLSGSELTIRYPAIVRPFTEAQIFQHLGQVHFGFILRESPADEGCDFRQVFSQLFQQAAFDQTDGHCCNGTQVFLDGLQSSIKAFDVLAGCGGNYQKFRSA